MVKPILYTIHLSPPCRAVELCAKALGIELEQRVVNLLAGEQLKPEFLKLNPQHTIPVLDDNGAIVRDSHAIMIYLVNKYGRNDALYPKEAIRQGQVNAGLHFNSGVLFARLRLVTEAVFFKKCAQIPQDRLETVQVAYQLLEDTLVDNYVAGSSLTIADFACVATVTSIMDTVPLEQSKYPKIHQWIGRMAKLPYYEEANGSGATQLAALIAETLKKNQEA